MEDTATMIGPVDSDWCLCSCHQWKMQPLVIGTLTLKSSLLSRLQLVSACTSSVEDTAAVFGPLSLRKVPC